jgi:hypothetical protein
METLKAHTVAWSASSGRGSGGCACGEVALSSEDAGARGAGSAVALTLLPSFVPAARATPDGLRWWQRDGQAAVEDVHATSTDDVRELLRDFVREASMLLVALQQEEEGWWAADAGARSDGVAAIAQGGTGKGSAAATARAASEDYSGGAAHAAAEAWARGRVAAGDAGTDKFAEGSEGGLNFLCFGSGALPPGIPTGSSQARVFHLVGEGSKIPGLISFH